MRIRLRPVSGCQICPAFRSLHEMAPKLSIITVTYNAEQFIEATIRSIAQQSFADKEYIVVDGKSNDRTLEILEQNRDTVSKLVSEKDSGLYDAMNKAIAMAEGEYLMFLNAGDLFYEEESLSELFEAAENQDVLYADTAIIDTEFELVGMRHMRPPARLSWKSFRNGMVVCHQAIVAKRSIAPFYDLSYQVAADIDWAIRLCKAAESFYFFDAPLIRFMQGGISTQQRSKGLKERYQVMTRYYGAIPTLFNNLKLGLRYLLSLRFIQNVRK